jgi:choline dehydrogenase-like flavoprotein
MMKSSSYDLCVVGAGMAGGMLSAVAARRGLKVLLVEAGPRFDFSQRLDQLKRSQLLGAPLWPWEDQGRDVYVDTSRDDLGYVYTLNDSRVKGVGGSTLHWGGMAQRLQVSDFETATRYGMSVDWPIGYGDLEPYYAWAEREIGVSGDFSPADPPRSTPFPMPGFPMKYSEAGWEPVAQKLGIRLDTVSHARNSQPYRGRSPCVAYSVCNLCPSGARYSAHFHVEEAERTGNCELLTETVARRIETDSGGRVVAIHASGLHGEEFEIRARHYAITAHAVESARLLLLSDVGNHSDQVGRNLMEHWYVAAGGWHAERNYPDRIGFTTLETHSFYDGPDRRDRGAIKVEFGGRRDPLTSAARRNVWGRKLAELDRAEFGHWLSVGAETEHQPNPDSRVTLDPEQRDQFGDPAPHLRFALSDVDRRTHERANEIVSTLLETRGAREIMTTVRYARGHHHMGTCRMSAAPEDGVVDRNCRVHGSENLYVVGSSVYPSTGARQPTLTIAALALRLADQLTSPPG